jgi:hypothetical protein
MDNKEFVFTKELVEEYARQYKFSSGRISVDDFIKDKEVKKEHLFITEDNIPVYKDDKFWAVDDKFNLYKSMMFYNHKYFSTEDAAKEYIANNKPRFSYMDIVRWFNRNGCTTSAKIWDKLYETTE